MSIPNSSDEPSLPSIRFAVGLVGEILPPAKVSLTEQIDGSINITVSGDAASTPAIARVATEVGESLPPKNLPLGERLGLVSSAIRSRFEDEGYVVQDLPLGDFKITAVLDLHTGRVMGRQEALHDLTPLDSEIADRVNRAMREVLQRGPRELAAEINRLIDIDDHVGAAGAVLEGKSTLGFFGVLQLALFESLQRINILVLPPELEREVCTCRMAVAAHLHKFDDAEVDAQIILDKGYFNGFVESAKFTNVVAFACFKRGEVETALAMWKDLLASPEPLLPSDRGWVLRNIANGLTTPSSEATRAARLSVDAFLEAGEKREAATSMKLLSKLLEFEGPFGAIEQLNNMLEVVAINGLMEDALRSSIYHSLALQLFTLRSFQDGLEAALESVSLLRGIAGAKKDLIASLNLASVLAKKCSDKNLSEQLDSEAVSLEESGSAEKFVIARRIHSLFSDFDPAAAQDISIMVNKLGDSELIAAFEVTNAISDPGLNSTARLRKLESVVIRLSREGASPEAKYPAMLAISNVLRGEGKLDRAGIWLRKVLADQPLNLDARDDLMQVLWESEAWGDAAIFSKEQIDLHGSLPGMLWVHGKSQFEAGDLSGALSTFMQALKKVDADHPLRPIILEFREKALEMGANISAVSPSIEIVRPILREELAEAFQEFSNFISGEKRMGFWYRPQPREEYKWVSRPEKRAQDLFHTFLKARFLHRISVYEELDTGAGRLDIYLRLDGGLSVIVELKMCGYGYPSNYAAAGESQIQHYMDNRTSNIGYLLVFDARLDKNKEKLIPDMKGTSKTIYEIFVDVRPRVSEKKPKR